MRRSVVPTIVIVMWLVACGGDGGATPFIPRSDASDEDTGVAGDSGVTADGGTGNDGAVPNGDLCSGFLRGISCDVRQITAGRNFSCALFGSGDVKCWGLWNGTVGDGPGEMGDALGFVDFDAELVEIAAGESELSARTDDGRVLVAYFGGSADGLLIESVAFEPGETAVALGGPSCALLADGTVKCWSWGTGEAGEIVEALNAPIAPPIDPSFTVERVTQASMKGATGWSSGALSNQFNTCLLNDASSVVCWGDSTSGQLGVGDHVPAANLGVVDIGEPVTAVVPGREHTCAILEAGSRLKCWGKNSSGQLGVNTLMSYGSLAGEISDANAVGIGAVQQVALGGDFTCAITARGATYCWGVNNLGQIGLGAVAAFGGMLDDIPTKAVPLNLGSGRHATQIALGENHACALLDDHSVRCWGSGQLGALGLGDPANRGDGPDELGDLLPRIDLGEFGRQELRLRGPVVAVVSPAASTDPEADVVHTGDAMVVVCGAAPSTVTNRPVDDESVRVVLHAKGSSGPVVAEASAARVSDGRYTATLLGLGTLSTDSYWIECVAADGEEQPFVGRANVQTLHDGGPAIAILAPAPEQVVGQAAMLHVEVSIDAAPLGASDPDADVASSTLSVAGVNVPLVVNPVDPTRYTADIDLLAPTFQPAPVGSVLISVTATNVRGTAATLLQTLMVDGTGPVITVQGSSHDNGDLIRGAQVMLLRLRDTPAGVDTAGSYGRIGSYVFPFNQQTGDDYRGVFDSLRFDRTVSQLTVEIHAFDRVGNESVETRSLQLDNQPPIVSLDPPNVREYKNAAALDTIACSTPFDPVGSDSLSDGDIAPEGAEFRARIEDRTNGLEGNGVLTYLALVDPERVSVYMLDDLSAPILIDTNGDDICDEINDETTPALRSLKAIPPAGVAYFPASAETDGLLPAWSGCVAGQDTLSPAPLCSATSPLTRTIKAPVLGPPVPAIYGLSVVSPVACIGDAWDWRLQFPGGGPVCVVARAEDHLGNVGVSPPIRVCLQGNQPGDFNCSANTNWQTHDCLAGDYGGASVSCMPPPDFGLDYVREDNQQ